MSISMFMNREEKVDFTAPISDKTLSEAMLSVKDSFAKAHLAVFKS